VNNSLNDEMNSHLQDAARNFAFPPTPDIAGMVMQRLSARAAHPSHRWRAYTWVLAIALIIILAGLLGIPSVRAAVVDFIQIGVVRIFIGGPTPTPFVTPQPAMTPLGTQTPSATPVDLISLLDLAGETTLTQARDSAGFPILLPTYPPDLGEPTHVFRQNLGGVMIVLVWTEPTQPDKVRLSLQLIGPGSWAIEKFKPTTIEATKVNGVDALWTTGPYLLEIKNGQVDLRRLMDGNALIWQDGQITYRLETNLSMSEAVKIAESLKPAN
jgi:Domain of unknown function (DUF4367)